MRNPEERLQEIQRRADERIAAIRKTRRTVAWIASSAAMCFFIGLAIRTMSSVPPAPIAPSTTTVTESVTTTTLTDTTPIDTTTTVVPTTTDLPVIFHTTYFPLTTTTAHGETETTATTFTSGTAHTITTSRTTATSKATTTTKRAPSTTTTSQSLTNGNATTTGVSPAVTTTATPHITSTQTPSATTTTTRAATTTTAITSTTRDIGGNMSPGTSSTTTTVTYTPSETTTTRDPNWDWSGDGEVMAPGSPDTPTTPTDPTATTTKPPYVFYSVSSAYEVSAGDIITVDVRVSDNHYMVLGKIDVCYDKNALELLPVGNNPDSPYVDYANPDILPDENVSWFVNTPYEGVLEFGFLSTSFCGSTTGGTIFRLTFRVLDGFENRTEIHLEFPFMVSANNPNGTAADDYNTRILKSPGIISAGKKP